MPEIVSKKVLPDRHENDTSTERGAERQEEDKNFTPVIVKRTDEAVRHPDDILENAINEGLEQLYRPFLSLVLSSLAAGLILGFSVMAVGVIASLSPEGNPLTLRLLTALVYPFGFVLCIMSGTQLFTEHTATAVYPVLEGKADLKRLLRLWLGVIMGNLLGAAFIAALLASTDQVIQAEKGYIAIAQHLVSSRHASVLFSAVLAGWLMALGAWLILATPPNISQIACIYIVTFLIGIGGLHHSIAGSVEIFTALFLSNLFSYTQTARFIGLAIIGNLIGGSIFVALLNYGHIRKTQQLESHS
jgi:formate/nitrite transporter FocA (FNT family)